MIRFLLTIIICLVLCTSTFAQKGAKKSNSEVLKMYGYEKNVNRHRKYPNVQIGDSTQPGKAKPRISFKGWDDEVGFEVDLGGSSQLTIPNNYIKNKGQKNGQDSIQIMGNNHYHAMFVTSDNRFEWSVVLDQVPPVNSITFPFTSYGLTFEWQDTLMDWEVADGAYRPDSIIYSYAIYHSTRSQNYEPNDGMTEEYTTGKFGHSFRPKAWDDSGDTVWISLLIDTIAHGVTISWDPVWMSNATYPVTIDPDVGFMDQGLTETPASTNRAHALCRTANVHTAGASQEVTALKGWVRVNPSGDETMSLAVYSMTGTSPFSADARLTNSENFTISITTADSIGVDGLSVAMTNGTVYGVAWGEASSTDIQFYFDGQAGARRRQNSATLGATFANNQLRDALFSFFFTFGDAAPGEPTLGRRRKISQEQLK